jgi:peptide/nickel transport system substrate-binding protein
MGIAGLYRNSLAEEWQIVDEETIRFKMRQGVHFALNPNSEASRLVNGREVTADDMVWSINYQWDYPTSYHRINMPNDRTVSVKAIGRYTMEAKVKANTQGIQLIQVFGRIPVIPHEVIEKYGDWKANWRLAVGTGPMILIEVVPGSTRSYIRNPNYFEVDPWFRENRLPYIDGYRTIAIPDTSTQQAAMRTAKIDRMTLNWDDAAAFKKNSSQLMQRRYAVLTPTLVGRMDKPGLPWGPQNDPNALKVRRAMNMAINKQELVEQYYGGNAELFAFPWPSTADFAAMYRPLDTYSEDIQELFQYKPDKAKQLLKEAGYPNGFKAIVTVTSTNADFAAVLKDYLSKVGIDLQIDMRDNSVMTTLLNNKSYPEMLIDINREQQSPVRMNGVRIETQWDYAYFEHPVTRAAYNDAQKWLMKDDVKVAEAWKSMNETYLRECKEVMLPMPYSYYVWWPWFKRFEGASNIGSYQPDGYAAWIWIDTDLKKQMGYRQ